MSRALAGIRGLGLADRSAALGGRVLAGLGAEVILVDPPVGAPVRHEAPFLGGAAATERSFAHLYLNTNKRSVVLDLDNGDFLLKVKRGKREAGQLQSLVWVWKLRAALFGQPGRRRNYNGRSGFLFDAKGGSRQIACSMAPRNRLTQ